MITTSRRQLQVRDDLDRFLENKKYPFVRYADDFVISVKTLKEGQRIMQEVTDFLRPLKLPINEEKSQIVRQSQLTFLGYSFRGRFLYDRVREKLALT